MRGERGVHGKEGHAWQRGCVWERRGRLWHGCMHARTGMRGRGGVHGSVACIVEEMHGRGGGMHDKDMHQRWVACMAGETSTAVYSTHPTGIHSCLCNKLKSNRAT